MEPPPEDEAHRVIIVGYGRVGALIGEMLDRHKNPLYRGRFGRQSHRAGAPARESRSYFGDATRPEFLRRCGIETARALVVTMDAPRANEAVVEAARCLRADLTLVARARDAAHAKTLYDLGVTDAVPETIEASLQLSGGGARGYRRADGHRHRLHPRETRRIPQDSRRLRRAGAPAHDAAQLAPLKPPVASVLTDSW